MRALRRRKPLCRNQGLRMHQRLLRAKRIRKAYFDEGLTQEEIAKKFGVSISTVSRHVRGDSFPGLAEDAARRAGGNSD